MFQFSEVVIKRMYVNKWRAELLILLVSDNAEVGIQASTTVYTNPRISLAGGTFSACDVRRGREGGKN